MISSVFHNLKKWMALLLVVLLLVTGIPMATAAADQAEGSTVRVKLSVGEVKTLSVKVKGTYTLQETGASFTDGTLTISGSGSKVSVKHSKAGSLYTGTSATICRKDMARTAGCLLTMPVANTTRSYLGNMTFTASSSLITAVNTVPISHYLYGVVGYEMSNAFPVEALKAQAIAAKNYVLARISTSGAYDIGDTSSDQVYKGYNSSYTNVITAVDATMGSVLLLNGTLMPCYYAASNGGYMLKPSTAWGGSKAYDAGYSEGYDDYDMKNPQSPRESLFIPTDFTEKNVSSAVFYKLVMDAFTAAIEKEGSIPEGYQFSRMLGISDVVSTDAKGKIEGLNHDRAVFTVNVEVTLAQELTEQSTTPDAEPTTTEDPQAEVTQQEQASKPQEETPQAEAAPTEAPAEGQEGAEATVVEAPAQEAAAVKEEETADAGALLPMGNETQEGTAAADAAATEPESTEEPAAPTSVPELPQKEKPKESLADLQPATREISVSFTLKMADLEKAGLFKNTKLRIYYVTTAEKGYTILHARFGHAIGLSQRGAQQMANEGKTYQQILAYYYGGATLSPFHYTFPEQNITLEQVGEAAAQTVCHVSTGKVSATSTKLRKTATATGKVLDTLTKNTVLSIYGMKGDFYAVTAEGKEETGYVACSAVTLTSFVPLASGTVNGANVNLRSGPGTGNTSLGKLDKGTTVTVYGMINGWYRLKVDGTDTVGYIIKRYVTITSPGMTLEEIASLKAATSTPEPTVAPTPTPSPTPAPTAEPTVAPAAGTTTPAPTDAAVATPAPSVTENTEPSFIAYGTTSVKNVNFRQGPSTATASYAKLVKGEAVGIYEKTGAWYRVRVLSTGRDGYVYARYVVLDSAAASSAQPLLGTLNTNGVNLRTGASTRFRSLGRLKKGTAITVLGSENGWYHVSVDATMKTGYVLAKYITLTAETSTTVHTNQGRVNIGLLNLRKEPSDTAAVVMTVRSGYTVTVLSVLDGWLQVTYNGQKGYCPAQYITLDKE